jgi:hypothetical protein
MAALPSTMKRAALVLASTAAVTLGVGCGGSCSGDEAASSPEAADTTVHGLTPAQAAEVAAVVGSSKITVGEVAEALNEQSPYLRTRFTSPERRSEFLDHMVQFELLVQEAERRGYRDRAEVQDARKQALVAELMREELDARLSPDDITDAEIRAYYESHPEEFDQPEQLRASHIVLAERAEAERLLAELRAAPGDMALFRRLATEHSIDAETAQRGGDLRFFSRPPAEDTDAEGTATGSEAEGAEAEAPERTGPPAAVARAAFELTENGQVSPGVVQTPAGFHLVARTAHRAAMRRTQGEVERVIRHRLYRDRRDAAIDALVERLRGEAEIELHPEVLAEVRTSRPERAAPDEAAPDEAPEEGD